LRLQRFSHRAPFQRTPFFYYSRRESELSEYNRRFFRRKESMTRFFINIRTVRKNILFVNLCAIQFVTTVYKRMNAESLFLPDSPFLYGIIRRYPSFRFAKDPFSRETNAANIVKA
jgi:hypothetical protein